MSARPIFKEASPDKWEQNKVHCPSHRSSNRGNENLQPRMPGVECQLKGTTCGNHPSFRIETARKPSLRVAIDPQ